MRPPPSRCWPGQFQCRDGRARKHADHRLLGKTRRAAPARRAAALRRHPAALLLPDGAGGQAFLVYENFKAIRRYNPSDFYALAVGALGRMILS
ncbi:lytic murein transglycosylase [Acidocella sp. MX-AZ03]|nr:lytic murein transglycosylase [Acidocella sp. MX-AZ03]WBO60091.1 lytic murein transglycosylase [Acidocella sp. MX-AZ03]